MASGSRSPRSSDWRDIASLGEQIVNATSLAEQRDHIVAMTSQLVKGDVSVWLHEKVFHLPNVEEGNLFPEQPDMQGMQRALKAGNVRTKQRRGKGGASRETWVAVPI